VRSLDLDAPPYPFFPELTNVWTDGPNWRLGHWLTGRLGAVSLAALVRHLCLRAGMPEPRIDVSGLWGAVEGYVISALEAPRASISTLARHFGFDAVESEERIKFLMRGRIAGATITSDSMVAPASSQGDVMELTRAQETDLPQALKWQIARAVSRVPDVLECHLMAGTADYLLKIVAADTEDFARIHRQYLTRLPGVAQMHTSFALRTVLQTTALAV